MNRTWITREEIAEIHEAIADGIVRQVGTGEDDDAFNARLTHFDQHVKAAETIREIDTLGTSLTKSVGW